MRNSFDALGGQHRLKSKRATGAGALAPALLCLLVAGAATAQNCEIPLFVKQGLDGANVMILADNSGSMNAAILAKGYDPDRSYTGVFTAGATYFIAKDGLREPSDFNRYWPATPSAYLINSDNGEDGRYDGNYLNWIYFHASESQRLNIPQLTRIQVLKQILSDIINRSDRLNFGLTRFQYDHGGSIIGKCGVNRTSLLAQIAGLTANTWTPLGEATEDILDYFADRNQSPITTECQYNFLIVVTDGLPTMDRDVSGYLWDADGDGDDPGNCAGIGAPYPESNECSDHFDDVTHYMAHNDLRSDLPGDQLVHTYVVGFKEDNRLLQDAAANGDGLYYYADNAAQLSASIEWAIQDILRRISAGSAVAVVSTERGTDDRLYRGKFMPVDWDGYLEAYALPYRDGDPALWEAGELLRNRNKGTRRIFTALNRSTYEFVAFNATTLRNAMAVATDAEAAALIEWGRGEDVPGFRDRRGWVLGPVVHSTPVVVGAPADFTPTPDYQAYFQANEFRRRMVYVGANDGMLHAFDAATGHESWAFVPELALPAFEVMADSFYCHKYSVDQTVTVKDVQLNGVWKTVLASGGRQGGSGIFALDVTAPDSPVVLWQADLPDGNTFTSDVEIATVAGEAIALVGSGLDVTNQEAWLHAYSMEDGTLLGSVLLSSSKRAARNKATRPEAVDVDLDGQADLVYIADLLGDIHRFDTSGGLRPHQWRHTVLYDGDDEITADPTAAHGPNGTVYVYAGTGAYLEDADMTTSAPQQFLCVIDDHSGSTATSGGLRNQTTSIGNMNGMDGWCMDLVREAGERVTQPAAVVAGTVIFTSFAPTQDACLAGGHSYLYQMTYDTGGLTEDQGQLSDRVESLGQGLASYPVVDLAQGTVVVQSSDASISVAPIANPFLRLSVRAWSENFDHANVPSSP